MNPHALNRAVQQLGPGHVVLRIEWERASTDPGRQTIVRFSVGAVEDSEPVATASADSLQLPDQIGYSQNIITERATLPADVTDRLQSRFDAIRVQHAFLYLPQSDGYLSAAPWEHWLKPLVPGSVKRTPYHIMPSLGGQWASIAVLLPPSTPFAFGIEPAPTPLTWLNPAAEPISVFTSRETYGAAKQLSGYGSTGHRLNVIMLDLDRAFATWRSDETEAPTRLFHPFLQSIIEQLGDRHLDVVHVVARCVPYGNRCALSFPRPQELSPAVPWCEEVTAEELDSFLMQVGAQACILSGARAHVSLYGLRSFAEELAKYAPRRVLVHELPEESDWASIWDPARGPSESTAQWVAPTVTSDFRDRLWHDVLDRLTWERRHDEMLDGRAPRWVYGAQRILERLAAESIEMAFDHQFAENRALDPVDSEILLSAFQNAKMLLHYCSKQPEFRGSDEALADLVRQLEGELGHSDDVRISVAY